MIKITKKSYAKVNIFLKIVAKRDTYHELVSRFVRVENLYDIVSFKRQECDSFTLLGNFGCETQSNIIYKAYLSLCTISPKVEAYFKNHKVMVEKNIPEFAGLGGGSSNAATFMNMVNEVCQLNISKKELAKIGASIGADVPFFIYDVQSANVQGIGEIVEPFDEIVPCIQTFTPNIQCNTGAIFKSFRKKFYKEVSKREAHKLLSMKTIDILNEYSMEEANDLYEPAFDNYVDLKPENYALPQKTFFSGSGSSFFYIS